MRRLGTMLPRNKVLLVIVSLVALAAVGGPKSSSSPNQAPAQQPQSGQPQSGQQPAVNEPMPGDAPNQPGNTVQVPAGRTAGQEPARTDNGTYVFRADVQ